MTDDERRQFSRPVAEEEAAKDANAATATESPVRAGQRNAAFVRRLRETPDVKGVLLPEAATAELSASDGPRGESDTGTRPAATDHDE